MKEKNFEYKKDWMVQRDIEREKEFGCEIVDYDIYRKKAIRIKFSVLMALIIAMCLGVFLGVATLALELGLI